ncbi:hypothetical protein [Noviherbaspirillum denitrificans]|uniref:Uncharacterized protein n=1 Tax=Noviherbaspirillum denitrificans TaxID=1968433 RepID=A0A254TGV4_9BURK|nr:hypothetical protein [Noviherbaspirillum denitrificans]OWW19773.1 hypothetical protein AYR66_09925 [Noviherbaspirillum denitrificans]
MSQAGSYLIDRHAAEKAVGLALPMIHEAMKLKEVGESGFLYIVVMDPLRGPHNASFEEAILYEYSVGDRSKWDADYAGFARAKARVAWRTGMDSHLVQELRPWLLEPGDTVLWGTAVVDGITVGVSGANPWYDEAFAGTVAMCLRAVAKAGIVQERGKGLFLARK